MTKNTFSMDNSEKVPKALLRLIYFSINFGFAWLLAWIFNPNLTSGTVSFFAAIYASLMTALDELRFFDA